MEGLGWEQGEAGVQRSLTGTLSQHGTWPLVALPLIPASHEEGDSGLAHRPWLLLWSLIESLSSCGQNPSELLEVF